MTATSSTPTQNWKPQVLSATLATITVAVISAPVRSNSSKLVYLGRSSVMMCSACAPRRPSRAISSSRAGETIVMAASAAASRPAIGTSAAATTSNSTSMLSTVGSAPSARIDAGCGLPGVAESHRVEDGGIDLGQPRASRQGGPMITPGVQQFVLQPEHLPLLGRLCVVVPEQVQTAVDGQQMEFVIQAVPGLSCL